MSILRSVALVTIWLVLQSVGGCSGKDVTAPPTTPSPSPPPTTKKYLVTSSDQSAVAGSNVTITAQLLDPANYNAPLAIAGRVVSWSQAGGPKGLFSSSTSTTDAGGKATMVYSTSIKAGSYRIMATDADGAAGTSDFVITIAGPPAKYGVLASKPVIMAGNAVLVSAYLLDINDNRVRLSGRLVTWTSSGTGSSFSAAKSSTDTDGIVTVNFGTSATGGETYVVTATDTSGIKGSTVGIQAIPGAQGIVAQAVVVGSAHSCVLDSAGMPSCWGWNQSGQLGNGFSTDFPGPVPVSGTLRFVSLAAGSFHTCGINKNGEAYCWGNNASGQLGIYSTSAVLNAMPVSGNLSFVALTAGYAHTCGIVVGGDAYCWGYNRFGQLGTGTTTESVVPLPVQGGLKFVALSAGGDHTCGIVDSGQAYCWGDNQHGQTGGGTTASVTLPTAVNGTIVFSLLSSGGSHTCGVAADGATYCWGKNSYGQLGNGSRVDLSTPSRIPGALRFTSLSAGFEHTCGLEASGVAYCWGSNNSGELGNGLVTSTVTPVPVSGNLVFASIAAGGGVFADSYYGPAINSHTCGVTVDRTAYCWGYNGNGQLGGNSAYGINQYPFNPIPIKVAGQR